MRVRRGSVGGTIAILVMWLAGASLALAADGGVVLVSDTSKVTMVAIEDGEGSADVVVQNQTATELPVSASPGQAAAEGCTITPTKGSPIPSYRQQTVTLTFSADCGIERAQGTNFQLAVGTSAFTLHADPPTSAHPNWVAVGAAYLAALLVAFAILALAYRAWTPPERPGQEKNWKMPLPGLSDSWKFADSWSANATVVTALFAGVFGVQGAAEALLGKSAAKEVLAVAVVAAAISLGLTGLSPMILQSLRTRTGEVPEVRVNDVVVSPKVDVAWYVTPRGLLAASLFTLVGTAGQLGAILWSVKETEFGQDWAMWLLLIVGAVGLAWYAWQTTSQSLDAGAKTPTAADIAKETQGKVDQAQEQQREVDNLRAADSLPDAIAAEERKAADLNSQAALAVASLRSVLEVTQTTGRPSPIP